MDARRGPNVCPLPGSPRFRATAVRWTATWSSSAAASPAASPRIRSRRRAPKCFYSKPGVSFSDVEQALGLKLARHAFSGWRRAALDFAALLRRLEIKCQLESRDGLTIATTPDQGQRLKREVKVRRDAGLEAPMLTPRAVQAEVAIASEGGIRDKGAVLVDPYRACLGIAQAAAGRGAQIFERTPVRRTKFTRKSATVITQN